MQILKLLVKKTAILGKRSYVKQSTITKVSEISGFMTVVQRLMNDSIYLAKIHTNRYS